MTIRPPTTLNNRPGLGETGLEGPLERLGRRIRQRRATVCVVGQGYVGFPLAQRVAEAGFPSYGFDISAEVTDRCTAANEHDGYRATSDPTVIGACDVILLAVPTPTRDADGLRLPDLSIVHDAANTVAEEISGSDRRARLIISESTYGPGTTRKLVAPTLRRHLEPGAPIAIGYSPERIDPGNRDYGLADIPKVTSGIDDVSASLTAAFYEQIITTVVPATSMEAAEATKLLENTFRFVNIAFAQEFDQYCDTVNLDSYEVTRLAATKPFGFLPFYAGAGVGGHCIAEDPYFLHDAMDEAGTPSSLMLASMANHDGHAGHVVDRIARRLDGRPMEGAQILVLGVSYKPNVADTRRSPALPVMHRLEALGAIVNYYDPHVPSFAGRASVDLDDIDPQAYDLAVVLVEHEAFAQSDLELRGLSVERLWGAIAVRAAIGDER